MPWVSDGRAVYAETIPLVDRDPERTGRRGRPPLRPAPGVGLVQAVKQRQGRRLVRVEVRVIRGEPLACPHTGHVERLNGPLRDRLACLTRQPHACAKISATGDAAVTLAVFEHNGRRPHPALRRRLPALGRATGRRYQRRTPARALGLTEQVWTWEALLRHPVSPQSRG